MRTADAIGGAILLFFSLLMIFVIIPAQTMPGQYFGLPPSFFPTAVTAAMAVFSLALVAKALLKPTDYAGEPTPLTAGQVAMFALVLAIVVAGVLVVDRVGYFVGAPLVIAAVALFMGERSPVAILGTAVVPVIVVWLLVTHVLNAPLP